jgi:hypothetical protein
MATVAIVGPNRLRSGEVDPQGMVNGIARREVARRMRRKGTGYRKECGVNFA